MMNMAFDAAYNNLKKKSFDIALRISDVESSLGNDNAKIIKLKKSFSKLQSAVNYSLYYKNNNMMKEANTHIQYAQKMAKYLYSLVEAVEIPTSKVEMQFKEAFSKKTKLEKRAKKLSAVGWKKGLKIRMSRKSLLILIAAGLIYVFVMWWFFIK